MRNIKNIINFFRDRELVIILIVILVSILFIFQLYNLQIVNGKDYREASLRKIGRNEIIEAPRGEIYDTNGVLLATNKISYDVVVYKLKIEQEKLNEGIYKLIDILDENNDKIYSSFPVNETYTDFNFVNSNEKLDFYKLNNLDINLTFNQVINIFKEKYKINENSFNKNSKIIKAIMIRYEANINNFSLTKSSMIAKDVSGKSISQIEELKYTLNGIAVKEISKREYVYPEMFAHTIGYISKINESEYIKNKNNGYNLNSNIGKTGIEQSFESYLKGENGNKIVEVDASGVEATEYITKNAISGNDVHLTLDYRLQKSAYDSLKNTINSIKTGTNGYKQYSDADSGGVVVLSADTSEVLALASYPSFDPNLFVGGISKNDWNSINSNPSTPLYNRAISGTYPPGSIYKMLVGITGLNTQNLTAGELITDTGIYPYGHHPSCLLYMNYHRTHGNINLAEALKVSCNVFFYEVGRRVGIDNLIKYSAMFGLGSKTGIEIKGESAGNIAGTNYNGDMWRLSDTLSASIGQSNNSYTLLQIANYITTIANGGNLNKVSIVKAVEKTDSSYIENEELLEFSKNIVNSNFESKKVDVKTKYIEDIKYGMYQVTNDYGGTSYFTFRDGSIKVGGKTGTVQVSSGSPNGMFVAFAPYENPKVVVAVALEHAGAGSYASKVAKAVFEEYFKISTDSNNVDTNQNVSKPGIKY